MARSKIPDPLEMWRTALTRMETAVNAAFARQVSTSPEFAKLLDRSTKVTLGVQHVTDKALAKALARLELPSRTEVQALAAAIQRVEDKLDQLLPAAAVARPPRPPRTRRPAAPATPATPAPAATPAVPALAAPATMVPPPTAAAPTPAAARVAVKAPARKTPKPKAARAAAPRPRMEA